MLKMTAYTQEDVIESEEINTEEISCLERCRLHPGLLIE